MVVEKGVVIQLKAVDSVHLRRDQADVLEQIAWVGSPTKSRGTFIANIGVTIQVTVHTSYRCEIDRKTSVLPLISTN